MIESKKFWDRAAAKYAKSPIKDMVAYEQTLDRTRRYLGDIFSVLEIGCGTGSTALMLAADVDHILATDISSEMIRIAQEKARQGNIQNVDFAQCDLSEGVSQQGPFDAILAFNLFHLLREPELVIADIASHLNEGGLLISKTPCLAGGAWKYLPFIRVLQFFGKAPMVRFLSVGDVGKLIEDAGFDIVEEGDYPDSPPCRFIVAVKKAA